MTSTGTSGRSPGSREQRIATMVARDRAIAIAFVALLWLLVIFVLTTMGDVIAQRGGEVVLVVSAVVQVVLVTAAVVSLVGHASRERGRIYGPDLDTLEANRAARRG